MRPDQLILGIDGGGSKTVAWLARCDPGGSPSIIGRGSAGPANIQSVGTAAVLEHLDSAIAASFQYAGVERDQVAAAVLGLAGSSREENQRALTAWADARRVARRFEIVSDALPVLAAASPECWGVALISGTGSFAFGRDRAGAAARAGGWGFLFGDEGSGYWIALAALRAAVRAADGRGPETQLTELLLERLGIRAAEELVSAVYPNAADRAWIASMADLVIAADERADGVARGILDGAASELASMVAAVARRLNFGGHPFPLGLAGGVLIRGGLRERLETRLHQRDLRLSGVCAVPEPVAGAVQLARALVGGDEQACR
jgi:N-acetylglucosamine kinase-like BadF-type ATPase